MANKQTTEATFCNYYTGSRTTKNTNRRENMDGTDYAYE